MILNEQCAVFLRAFISYVCVSVCIGVLCVRVHSWGIPEMAYFVPRENTFGFSGCLCKVSVFL